MLVLIFTLTIFGIFFIYHIIQKIFESFTIDEFTTKCVLITGCDSGFGKKLAFKCNDKGFIVFACCLTKEGYDEFYKSNKRIIPYLLDITNPSNIKEFTDYVTNTISKTKSWKLYALINNASIFGAYGPDDWGNIKFYENTINVNVLGTIRMIHAFKEQLKKNNGRIITMSSCVANTILPYAAPYNISKAAIEKYIDTIRLELKNWNVKCILIQPSCYKTEMLQKESSDVRLHEAWSDLSLEMKKYYNKNIFKKFKKAYFNFIDENASMRMDDVINCYIKALISKYPKPRYQVGFKSKTILTWLSFIPTRCSDFAVYQLAMKKLEKILHSQCEEEVESFIEI
ncbi:Short-chain dehydrogenase/reductase SDR family and Glucose/ribitol dehydrogenase family and NAD(P)-binding domain-containing protein [Strongyloides ratti]|uniref:Short-chain dehydrogenase/reductase SDR family and Glucose/ribitol dehydrogenase family and NAD(P)-binding domain-containing protein n=1 Tax=Strongyloides ratti TaxID=34506 RepID=A0A090LMU9_STRRB|nr:Short-chain dehydrogenase/reductase SDR family and Glucose/ribitol dehydrogenase family and NAD(P)-binding domain-containing protein [Strongyloides ratti]CEF68850.1 Short-chain dehydrogenase/reductase SDR family and Glucose/ribitol dehydrogenase family and NAD(P)-binding domain-containing protein [Strongyloides ratti]